MPIKCDKHEPVPQPLPPPTYSISGLEKWELEWVKKCILHGSDDVFDQSQLKRRLLAIIGAKIG
jgi:hypothetical protein